MAQKKKAYVAPEIEKREKLSEVAGLPTLATTVSGADARLTTASECAERIRRRQCAHEQNPPEV